jgi:hypothetical protein
LAASHCEGRKWPPIPQGIAVLQTDHCIVERGTAVEHPCSGIVVKAVLTIPAGIGKTELVLGTVEPHRVANGRIDFPNVQATRDRIGSSRRRRSPVNRRLRSRTPKPKRFDRSRSQNKPACRCNHREKSDWPAGTRPSPHETVVELKRVVCRFATPKLTVGTVDLDSARRVAAFTIGMMLLDQPLVSLLDRRCIGAGLEAQNGKCGYPAGHGKTGLIQTAGM